MYGGSNVHLAKREDSRESEESRTNRNMRMIHAGTLLQGSSPEKLYMTVDKYRQPVNLERQVKPGQVLLLEITSSIASLFNT